MLFVVLVLCDVARRCSLLGVGCVLFVVGNISVVCCLLLNGRNSACVVCCSLCVVCCLFVCVAVSCFLLVV